MELKTDDELANTRATLARLEKLYDEVVADPSEEPDIRDLTLRSLKGTINQFKEEIARFEARHSAQTTLNR